MTGSTTGGSPPGRVDAESVISAFTGMLHVGFVYPANNPRVAAVCSDLVQVLHAFSPTRAPVEIEVDGDALRIGDRRFDRDRDEVARTLERLDRADLRGIRFESPLDPRALVELNVALRTCFPPGAPRFADVWRWGGAGVTPLVREAEPQPPVAGPETGAAPEPSTPPEEPAPAAYGTATGRPRRSPFASGDESVLGRLTRSNRVRETLATIHARFEDEFAGEEPFDAAGTLERLVSDLPDAIRCDAEAACGHVETVLDLVLAQLEMFLLSQPADPAERLADIASTLLRRQLPGTDDSRPGRPATPAGPGAAKPSRGRTGPDAATPAPATVGLPFAAPIDHSQTTGRAIGARAPAQDPALDRSRAPVDPRVSGPTSLLGAIEKLPRGEDFDTAHDGPALSDELFGACLHLLAFGADEGFVSDGSARLLAPLIENPSSAQRRILGAYVRLARESAPGDAQVAARARLVGFLQRNGVQSLVSSRAALDFETVVETFPQHFVVFLDTLDAKDADSERTFRDLLDAVGDDAMDAATKALIEDGSLLTPNRTEKLLRFGGKRAARIARRLVQTGAAWTRTQVVNFLRRQDLPRSDSAALAIVRPISTLPTAYLADLCGRVARGGASASAHDYSSLLLRQFVHDTADKPGDLDRRLYAIRALGYWPAPETLQYLEQLAKEGRFLQQGKEARAIRQAAADALAQIRAQQGQQA